MTREQHILNLSSWDKLSTVINDYTEEELVNSIIIEMVTKCRMSIIMRLHSRYNTIRREREKTMILDLCNKINEL